MYRASIFSPVRSISSALPKFKRPTCNDGRPSYFDVQSTTMIDPRVLDAMLPWLTWGWGNPHSRTHPYGWEAESAVEEARSSIASLIGASSPTEIIFTSGATESTNLAIRGVIDFYGSRSKPSLPHIITSVIEHKCVLDTCRALEESNLALITYLPVDKSGLINLEELEASIRPETRLVTIMAVNNEIGSIQPITEIGQICKRHQGVYFHCDAPQAVGKIPINVEFSQVDLLSISGHKIYGPKGIGALFVRRRPRVRLSPLIHGGGQERSLRSGTLPAPLAVGLGAACRIAASEMAADARHISDLSSRLRNGLFSRLPLIQRNGSTNNDLHLYDGCVNISFGCVEGESLLMALKDSALSSGSACTSASLEPSYVLRALGTEEDMAHSSIRFGIGRFTTRSEIDSLIDKTVFHVRRLRDLSPLWEMVQQGIDLRSIQWTQH